MTGKIKQQAAPHRTAARQLRYADTNPDKSQTRIETSKRVEEMSSPDLQVSGKLPRGNQQKRRSLASNNKPANPTWQLAGCVWPVPSCAPATSSQGHGSGRPRG